MIGVEKLLVLPASAGSLVGDIILRI